MNSDDPVMATQAECLAALMVAVGLPKSPLTPMQREVMKLTETLSERKIAARLGIDVHGVRQHLQHALKNLRLEEERFTRRQP